jgi:hypothetical protein
VSYLCVSVNYHKDAVVPFTPCLALWEVCNKVYSDRFPWSCGGWEGEQVPAPSKPASLASATGLAGLDVLLAVSAHLWPLEVSSNTF